MPTTNIKPAIASGEICSGCKEYFGDPKGRPTLCPACEAKQGAKKPRRYWNKKRKSA